VTFDRRGDGEITFGVLLFEAASRLTASSETARLDAELLLGHVSGLSRLELITRMHDVVPPAVRAQFDRLVQRREAHEPVAYLLGTREFFGLRFEVSPAVLVPRPETEHIVERALEFVAARPSSDPELRILDLGTGSGCLIVSLAQVLSAQGITATYTAVDRSEEAVAVARRNAARHGVDVRFLVGDWFAPIGSEAPFHLIVTNPPYIPDGCAGLPQELGYEPPSALFSGHDGLRDIRVLLGTLPRWLHPSGLFLCEIGAGQDAVVLAEASRYFEGCSMVADYSGTPRVLMIQGAAEAKGDLQS
jgi:release factor glutamine methyltransferase